MSDSPAAPLQRRIGPTPVTVQNSAQPVFGELRRLGEIVGELGEAKARMEQADELSAAQLSATKKLDDVSLKYRDDPDPATAGQRYADEAAKIGDETSATLRYPESQQAFKESYGRLAEARRVEVAADALTRQHQDAYAGVIDGLGTYSQAAAAAKNPVEREAIVKQASDALAGAVKTGVMNARDAQRIGTKWRSELAIYDARRAIDANPVAAVKALQSGALPDLDLLERDREIGRGQAEILTREREARAAQRDARIDAREAVAELEDINRSGLPISHDAYDSARALVAQSGDAAIAARFTRAARVSNYLTSFRGVPPIDMKDDNGKTIVGIQTILTGLERQAETNGADEALASGLQAARKFADAQAEGLKSDPLMYASAQGRARIGTLALNGGDSADAWKQRTVAAEKVADYYATRPVYLTKSESDTVAAALAPDQPAKTRLAVAKNLISGLGNRSRSVFADLAKADPVIAQAGLLLLNGNEKAATDAVNGQALMKTAQDGKQSDLRPSPSSRAWLKDAALPKLGKATGAMMPDLRGRVLAAADAIYAARAVQHGFTGASIGTDDAAAVLYNNAVQEAAGATFDAKGNQYGGIGDYRDVPVILPKGLPPDAFEDAVHGLSDLALTTHSASGKPPVHKGKQLTAADLRRLWLVSAGEGLYAISVTDPSSQAKFVTDADGRLYRFSLTQAFDHPAPARKK